MPPEKTFRGDSMVACVIGCIFGKNFKAIYPAVKKYDSYFFTNNPEIKPMIEDSGWKYIFINLPLSEDDAISSLQSKYIKFLQFLKEHELSHFLDYDRIIYTDHKFELKDNHIEYLLETITDKKILVRDNPKHRNHIWEEVCLAMHQERYLRFMPQTIDYIREKLIEGYTEKNSGCTCNTGLILYNIREEKVLKFADEVYNDLIKIGTSECQIIWAMVGQKYIDIIRVIPWNDMNIRHEEPKIEYPKEEQTKPEQLKIEQEKPEQPRTKHLKIKILKKIIKMFIPYGVLKLWKIIKARPHPCGRLT